MIRSRESFAEAVAQASQHLIGRVPQQIIAPGGSFRGSIRLAFTEGHVMLTRRMARARGWLEAECLRRLSAEGAPVPRLIARDGTWLVQDHVPGRLSVVLAGDIDPPTAARWPRTPSARCSRSATRPRARASPRSPPLGANREADEYFSAVIEDVTAAVGRELDARTSGAAAERLDCQAIFATMHAAVRLELILNRAARVRLAGSGTTAAPRTGPRQPPNRRAAVAQCRRLGGTLAADRPLAALVGEAVAEKEERT